VYEILEYLQPGALVLDLGCRNGSFPINFRNDISVIRVDLEKTDIAGSFVQADAQHLPFPSKSFDAVILNHTLEHIAHLKPSLQEIGRVVKSSGAAFVAVPDARTLADRIYRKVYRDAGGHVNLFDSPEKLAAMVSWYFGMPHLATRTLLTSFNFLNRNNPRDIAIPRQLRFFAVPEFLLACAARGARLMDRHLKTRTGVYGWAMYFGQHPFPVDLTISSNVCVRCGQGSSAAELIEKCRFYMSTYRCPDCGGLNFFDGASEDNGKNQETG
jgi:SAM-dependent methyltransferase